MKNRTKSFLEPDYMIRCGPVCQAGLFCKMATSAFFSCNLVHKCLWFSLRLTKMWSSRSQSGKPRQPVWKLPEGFFQNFWVGMCSWDSWTLSLYQCSCKWILLHFTRVNSQNPAPPIPEYLFCRNYWGHKHNPAKFFYIFEWQFPVRFP